jgi:cytochrome c oxidase subunit 2
VLEGLYKKKVELQDGSWVTADDSYIRESILVPAAKVRQGYRPIMPSYEGQVSQDDLVRLLAYIKSLRPGDLPPRVEDSPPPAVNEKDVKYPESKSSDK